MRRTQLITDVGPFERHLWEAIALNRERAPLYAEVSSGESRSLSRLLIAAEWLLLPVARWFDREAAPYHRAGVPLLEAVFVPMSGAPAFGSVHLAAADAVRTTSPDPSGIRQHVRRAYREASFTGAREAIADEVHRLMPLGGSYLARHLLESAHRVASLAPDLITQSLERGLPSPERILARLLWLHLWGLTPAHSLDNRAGTLHARRIPILAQDLPPIPISRETDAWP